MTIPDPKAKTSAPPQVIDGVTFHCYRTGIGRTAWISEDGRIHVQRNYNSETYCASIDGTSIEGTKPMKAKRFRTQSAAMLAAVFKSRSTE